MLDRQIHTLEPDKEPTTLCLCVARGPVALRV
jgi:hypothetical protein